MTKRKRDIFTVIESINIWFEANEHCTDFPPNNEGSAIGSDLNTELGANPEINCPAVGSRPPVGNQGHNGEVGYGFPDGSPSHVGVKVESEVAAEAANRAANGSRLVARAEGIPEYEKGVTSEDGPGSSGPDTLLITPAVTEEVNEVDSGLTGIWMVFKDAGYDVW